MRGLMGFQNQTDFSPIRPRMALFWKMLLSALLAFIFFQPSECMFKFLGRAPDLMGAKFTNAIKITRLLFHQNYDEQCPTEAGKLARYRSANGTCNHVKNYGTTNLPLLRLLPPHYDDGMNSPRSRDSNGFPLASPTDISRMVHSVGGGDTVDRTVMFMQWGQFIDHDLGLAPVGTSDEHVSHCCNEDGSFPDHVIDIECFPIRVSPNDTRFKTNCMEFVRSASSHSADGKPLVPRQQLNSVTAFLDGSVIYGNSRAEQDRLRIRGRDGILYSKLRTTKHKLLPRAFDDSCNHEEGHYCFLAGDERVNEQPALAVLHTVWVRLHNMVVWALRRIQYSLLYVLGRERFEERMFQQSRKIVVAVLQNIHYLEWLPMVLGKEAMSKYNLWPCLHSADPHGVSPDRCKRVAYPGSVDPRITNAFTTAAFRFGHSLIPNKFYVNGKDCDLKKLFHRPDLVFNDFFGLLSSLVHPTWEVRSQKLDRHVVAEVTGHLFEPDDQDPHGPSRGLDLVALNIQRGRDHGLPPYNRYRELCELEPVKSFYEFGPEVGAKLATLYRSVDDIDLFTGGMLETAEEEGTTGPTFTCIMAKQFYALKYGDKFYFETDGKVEGFCDDQLRAIRKITLAHVLCTFMTKLELDGAAHMFQTIQKRVFNIFSEKENPKVDCVSLRGEFSRMVKTFQTEDC